LISGFLSETASSDSTVPITGPLRKLILKLGNSLLIAVLENKQSADPFLKSGVKGIIYRDVPNTEIIKYLRSVASGINYVQQRLAGSVASIEQDTVGQQIHDRLTAKELRIVGLLAQGYKNKDTARELNNSERVIKNHFRSIFDMTGFSDRLEVALFTIQHRILFEDYN
jgi:DNA-binding NarL/FixJ family response regulator